MTNQFSSGFSTAYWEAYHSCWDYCRQNPEASLVLSVSEGEYYSEVMLYDETTGDTVYWNGHLTQEETEDVTLVFQEFAQ